MATATPKHGTSNGRKWTMPSLPHILPAKGEKLEGSGFEDFRLEEGVEAGEDLALDDRKLPVAYQSGRHVEAIVGSAEGETQTWRSRERMKTVRYDMIFFFVVKLATRESSVRSVCNVICLSIYQCKDIIRHRCRKWRHLTDVSQTTFHKSAGGKVSLCLLQCMLFIKTTSYRSGFCEGFSLNQMHKKFWKNS